MHGWAYLDGSLIPSEPFPHFVSHPLEESTTQGTSTPESPKGIERAGVLKGEVGISLQICAVLLGIPESVDDARRGDRVLHTLIHLRLDISHMVDVRLHDIDRVHEVLSCTGCYTPAERQTLRTKTDLMYAADEVLPLRGFFTHFSLFEIIADLRSALDMCAISTSATVTS